ncbi:hypothetical protein TOPH_03453 [Tolypocladium ophioglossoides CBS 100239]|uniref:Uncharacterized protein n=1 Tax=Tolypocladium ophioglossoides (strain CBS 100239) TaxID=1163406 RepID=A0A0L0NCZ2_TOLOC|nr:hypothetical protein TOPH_03453 [Tolypocladium ophioglossoides CBS 100239]
MTPDGVIHSKCPHGRLHASTRRASTRCQPKMAASHPCLTKTPAAVGSWRADQPRTHATDGWRAASHTVTGCCRMLPLAAARCDAFGSRIALSRSREGGMNACGRLQEGLEAASYGSMCTSYGVGAFTRTITELLQVDKTSAR